MCRPASMIVTKSKVFWSEKSDSHEDIVEEFGLKERDVRKNYTFVRVEIVPPNNDYKLPFSRWAYHLDQDLKPEWYDAKDAEKRVRRAVKDWRKTKVIMPNEKRNLKNDDYILVSYGTVKSMRGSSTVVVYTKFDKGVLKSAKAVIIDRSGDKARCYTK